MRTILHNTHTSTNKHYPKGYSVDGVIQPLGEIQYGVWHLEVIQTVKPDITDLQDVTLNWIPNFETNQWVQTWTVRDLTEQELQERKEANTPIEITRWQLREGLRRQGKMATVDAMIATLDEGVQDWWNVSGGNVDRTDAIIQNLADQLGIDVLDFWQYCSTLKVGE